MIEENSIRVLSVDDHPLLRDGLAALINNRPGMVLVGQASSAEEGLAQFRKFLPDVTLMDLRLPDKSGIDAIKDIRAEFPEARVIVLTTFEGDVEIQRALEAGARAYILKNMAPKELLDVIEQVHAGKKRIPSQIAAHLAEHLSDESLPPRDRSSDSTCERQPQPRYCPEAFYHRGNSQGPHQAHHGEIGGRRPYAGCRHWPSPGMIPL